MILYKLKKFPIYLKIRQLKKKDNVYPLHRTKIFLNLEIELSDKQYRNNDRLLFYLQNCIYLSSTFDVSRVKKLRAICKSFESAHSAKRIDTKYSRPSLFEISMS